MQSASVRQGDCGADGRNVPPRRVDESLGVVEGQKLMRVQAMILRAAGQEYDVPIIGWLRISTEADHHVS